MKLLKNIAKFSVTIITITVMVLSTKDGQQFASNIFTFLTVLALWSYLTISFNDEMSEKLKQSYLDGKHHPEWFDILYYSVVVLFCAGNGWWWCAVAWFFVGSTDLVARKKALGE